MALQTIQIGAPFEASSQRYWWTFDPRVTIIPELLRPNAVGYMSSFQQYLHERAYVWLRDTPTGTSNIVGNFSDKMELEGTFAITVGDLELILPGPMALTGDTRYTIATTTQEHRDFYTAYEALPEATKQQTQLVIADFDLRENPFDPDVGISQTMPLGSATYSAQSILWSSPPEPAIDSRLLRVRQPTNLVNGHLRHTSWGAFLDLKTSPVEATFSPAVETNGSIGVYHNEADLALVLTHSRNFSSGTKAFTTYTSATSFFTAFNALSDTAKTEVVLVIANYDLEAHPPRFPTSIVPLSAVSQTPKWLVPLHDGFTVELVKRKSMFRSSVGPTIERSKSTKLTYRQNWSVILKGESRYNSFLRFFEATHSGALTVRTFDPATKALVFMRILNISGIHKISHDVWKAQMNVEMLQT